MAWTTRQKVFEMMLAEINAFGKAGAVHRHGNHCLCTCRVLRDGTIGCLKKARFDFYEDTFCCGKIRMLSLE